MTVEGRKMKVDENCKPIQRCRRSKTSPRQMTGIWKERKGMIQERNT